MTISVASALRETPDTYGKSEGRCRIFARGPWGRFQAAGGYARHIKKIHPACAGWIFFSDNAWSRRYLDCRVTALPEKLETNRFYPADSPFVIQRGSGSPTKCRS
ncbi:MAG: hypothetical protein CBARDMAM_2045 [uncultured Caballeronia sp.]|nr:MAG: hypothetical protein CBARDMAM_2045 [uncultured Caballeronia sp.]